MPTTLGGETVVLDTLTREYEDFRTQAIEIASVSTPEWTDFNRADPGVALLEILSGGLDVVSYALDRYFGEAHWSTAQLRQSMVDMGSLIGYTLSPPSSSTVNVEVTVPIGSGGSPLYGTDSIAFAPFRISSTPDESAASFSFELLETVPSLAEGTTTLVFIEGRTILNELLGTAIATTPSQKFNIASSPITLNPDSGEPAVQVKVNSVVWTLVPNFIDSTASSQEFIVTVDASGVGTITFGDGVNGAIPSGTVEATYRVGGGSASNNINIGLITQIDTPTGIDISVSNSTKPSGGDDAETVEHARQQGPRRWATQDRAVTHADYEALAREVNGVYRSKARWYDNSPLKEAVYIATTGDNPVPSGTWDPAKQSGTGLLGIVGDVLVDKSCAATQIYMLPVTALDVVLDIQVTAKSNYYNSDVESRVTSAVDSFIRLENSVDIPNFIPLSGLMQLVEGIAGVEYLDVTLFHRQPYIEVLSAGIADTVLSAVVAAGDLKEEEWCIRFTSSTEFVVYGTISGAQNNLGTINTEYSTDEGTLTFTLTAGSILNKVNDQYRILTSSKVGNVALQDTEMPILSAPSINISGGIA